MKHIFFSEDFKGTSVMIILWFILKIIGIVITMFGVEEHEDCGMWVRLCNGVLCRINSNFLYVFAVLYSYGLVWISFSPEAYQFLLHKWWASTAINQFCFLGTVAFCAAVHGARLAVAPPVKKEEH